MRTISHWTGQPSHYRPRQGRLPRSRAITSRQDTVKGSRRTAALEIAQDRTASFDTRLRSISSASYCPRRQAHLFKAIFHETGDRHLTAHWFGPFGNNNDTKLLSLSLTGLDLLNDRLDPVGDFRDQDYIRSAGKAGMKGNPPRIAPHDFQGP